MSEPFRAYEECNNLSESVSYNLRLDTPEHRYAVNSRKTQNLSVRWIIASPIRSVVAFGWPWSSSLRPAATFFRAHSQVQVAYEAPESQPERFQYDAKGNLTRQPLRRVSSEVPGDRAEALPLQLRTR